MKNKNIPIFVSHIGCPKNCIFCNQKKISGSTTAKEIENCKQIIDEALLYIKNEEIEIAFFGGSFTGIPLNKQRAYLEVANQYIKDGKVSGIRLSTRPDYINIEILDLLKEYGVTTIELGVQSMCDDVLSLNNRGMTNVDTINAVNLIKKYDFNLGIQMMTSMYGSNFNKDIKTAKEIVELKPDFVRVYPTVVIEDTKLHELYENGEYKIKTLEETVEVCSEIYEIFDNRNIPIIRIGLMSSDEINCDKVIGAYHPAFGELVIGRFYYNKMLKILENAEFSENTVLTIRCKKELVSKINGHKKENTMKLKEKFHFKYINFEYTENDLELVWSEL